MDKLEAEDRDRSAASKRVAIGAVAMVCIVFVAIVASYFRSPERGTAMVSPQMPLAIQREQRPAASPATASELSQTPVFMILSMGQSDGEFSFTDRKKGVRKVVDVHAPPGVDIKRAMVGRMIQFLRAGSQGDVSWESNRLGRVVTISIRTEDEASAEDFLMKEFFGTASGPAQ